MSRNFNNQFPKNSDNKSDSRKHHGGKMKKFPAPRQIKGYIDTQLMFNFIRGLLDVNDYVMINYTMEVMTTIRRSIMQVKCDNEYVIDSAVVADIMNSKSSCRTLPTFLIGSQLMPTNTKWFDSKVWTLIYRGMLPWDHPIEFTIQVFKTYLMIFKNIRQAEVVIERERLEKERDVAIEKEIKRLDRKADDYANQCLEIKQKHEKLFYQSVDSINKEVVWRTLLEDDRYVQTHPIGDFNDPCVVMIWSTIMLDLNVCGINPYVNDLVHDPNIFRIEFVDKYTDNDFWSLIQALRLKFFTEFPDYSNDTCTEEQFGKWIIINQYCEVLIQVLKFKRSERTAEDVISFDVQLHAILRTTIIEYDKFSFTTRPRYSSIHLEDKCGKNRIQLLLNAVSESNCNVICEQLTMLFDPIDIIPVIISTGVSHKGMESVYLQLLSRIATNEHSELILTSIDSIKFRNDIYWTFYVSLYYLEFIHKSVPIDVMINSAINSCGNSSDSKSACIVAFIYQKELNMKLYTNGKPLITSICDDFVKLFKNFEKYRIIDAIEKM